MESTNSVKEHKIQQSDSSHILQPHLHVPLPSTHKIIRPIKVESYSTSAVVSSGENNRGHHHQFHQINSSTSGASSSSSSNSPTLFNIKGEKVVMATPPVQVVMQQQQRVGASQFIQQSPSSSSQRGGSGLPQQKQIITIVKNANTNTIVQPVVSSISSLHHTGQTVKSLSMTKNNISVSPVKGGFKIPISPMKHPMKFSVVPSNNIVKTISLQTPLTVDKSQVLGNFQQQKATTNFQFQTIPQGNKVQTATNSSGTSNQTFTIQTMNQFQGSNTRAPCTVRLIPTNGQVANQQPTLIPVQTAGDQNVHAANVVASGGGCHSKAIAPFVSFQQVRSLPNIKPHPRLIMPAASSPSPKITSLSPATTIVKQPGTNNMGYALVPAKYVEQFKKQIHPTSIYNPEVVVNSGGNVSSQSENNNIISRPTAVQQSVSINGKVHKPCNCTKSMCLKLYCECFANGHFCDGCNCINCHNNLDYDSDRSKAIRSCLDRNPYAFRPKIGRGRDDARAHQKGCNCRRSGCLKNYCECYEARIPCTSRCKCIGCKNLEGSWPASRSRNQRIGSHQQQNNQPLMSLADACAARHQQQQAASSRLSSQIEDMHRPSASRHSKVYAPGVNGGEKQPSTFFSNELIDATCVCLLAQAEEAEKSNLDEKKGEELVIKEFGRCMMQIIEAAQKTKAAPASSSSHT